MKTVKPKPRVAILRHDRDGFIRCRVCGCTEREPCNPPCSWAPGAADLCSTCADIVLIVAEWRAVAHRASWAALKREVEALEAGSTFVLTEAGRNWRRPTHVRRPYHGSAAEGNC